jgi:hypothetical protein
MELGYAVSQSLHVLFGGALAGGVLFAAVGVLGADAGDVGRTADRLAYLSRASAVVLLATGGHMAGTRYADALFSTTSGHLVLGMLALWTGITALVEVGRGRLDGGRMTGGALTAYRAAAALSVLVLVDAGLLAAV